MRKQFDLLLVTIHPADAFLRLAADFVEIPDALARLTQRVLAVVQLNIDGAVQRRAIIDPNSYNVSRFPGSVVINDHSEVALLQFADHTILNGLRVPRDSLGLLSKIDSSP